MASRKATTSLGQHALQPRVALPGTSSMLIHKSQAVNAQRVPSEATLPSWALWHGLKMVLAPQPYYQDPRHDISEMDEFWNGGPIGSHENGMTYGLGMYNCTGHGDIVASTTWAWGSEFPSKIMNSWLEDKVDAALPCVLQTLEGHVMAPNLAIHPRKTNRNP